MVDCLWRSDEPATECNCTPSNPDSWMRLQQLPKEASAIENASVNKHNQVASTLIVRRATDSTAAAGKK